MNYSNKEIREQPVAKVEYELSISVVGSGMKQTLEVKDQLVVREPPNYDFKLEQTIESKIKKYYCFNAGKTKNTVSFRDCYYDLTETAVCNFKVDNKDSSVDVAEIKYQMHHYFCITVGRHTCCFNNIIADHTQPGIHAQGEKEFQGAIDLKSIGNHLPSISSRMIKSSYYQSVKLSLDSNFIFANMPTI